MVHWAREPDQKLLAGAKLSCWLESRPSGPWWDLIREAAEQYSQDTGGAELPSSHFIEWLAEWGRDYRRRQCGMLLLTAHRAKGLEFRHVAVLDGNWDRGGRNEDPDAPRRLYYVAMTRAKETLTLLSNGSASPLLTTFRELPSAVRRVALPVEASGRRLRRCFERLTLDQIDLGFAGRHAPDHPVHDAIAALRSGDNVEFIETGGRIELRDANARVVGRLAKAYKRKPGFNVIDARVRAVTVRRRGSNPDYRESERCDRWEVIVPEFVHEPTE